MKDDLNRPRGRPPVPDKGSTVSVWIPSKAHDKLIQMANAEEKTISALARSWLMLKLR